MEFWSCACYVALIGCIGFLLGRIIPKGWINSNKFPFASLSFEDQGKLYEKLGIRFWHKRLPDMSKVFPGLMPAKKIGKHLEKELPVMIRETCVAEMTHWALIVASLHCLQLWPGVGGICIVGLNILGNLPFILIQRYNRPRLQRLYRRFCPVGTAENAVAVTK